MGERTVNLRDLAGISLARHTRASRIILQFHKNFEVGNELNDWLDVGFTVPGDPPCEGFSQSLAASLCARLAPASLHKIHKTPLPPKATTRFRRGIGAFSASMTASAV